MAEIKNRAELVEYFAALHLGSSELRAEDGDSHFLTLLKWGQDFLTQKNETHSGDCTKESHPCSRCLCDEALRIGRLQLCTLESAGLAIVPVEATDPMLLAGTMQVPTWDYETQRRKYNAMIAASPFQNREG